MATNEQLVKRRQAAMRARQQALETAPYEHDDDGPEVGAPLNSPSDEREGTVQPRNTPTLATEAGARNRTALRPAQADAAETLTANDVIMPKVKISQAMSKVNAEDVVRQGNWYHSTRNDNLGKKIVVLPVGMRKSRSMFEQGKGVVCRSFDMRNGEGTPGIACEGTDEEIASLPPDQRGCRFRLWTNDPETGRRIPPKCQEAYNYPVLLLDPENLDDGRIRRAMMTFRGTSIPAAKAINSEIMESGTEWVDNIFELSLVSKTNTKGTFFIPVTSFVKESSGRVREQAIEFARTVNAKSVRATLETDDE